MDQSSIATVIYGVAGVMLVYRLGRYWLLGDKGNEHG